MLLTTRIEIVSSMARTMIACLTRILAIDAASPLMPAVYALRRAVFVVEQGVPADLEYDEFDAIAIHLAALQAGCLKLGLP